MDADEDATDDEVNDVMRVEWATSFTQMERWAEEVELLQEEMRWVVAFLECKLTDWLSKRETRSALVTSDIQSGLDAYARKQAAVYHDLTVSFSILWSPTLISHNFDHSWITACLQQHEISLTDTSTSCSHRIFKHQALSDTKHNQPNTPPVPQVHNHLKVHNVDKGMLLDEVDSDSSTDSMQSDTNGSGDDDNNNDFDFDFY